jgi:hypothetical protein
VDDVKDPQSNEDQQVFRVIPGTAVTSKMEVAAKILPPSGATMIL